MFPGSLEGIFEPQKKMALLSMKYWLFNRDPYNGLL